MAAAPAVSLACMALVSERADGGNEYELSRDRRIELNR